MPNLNSDQLLFLTVVFNVITYFVVVWRQDRKHSREQGEKNWKFKAMWREYAKAHNIPANGDDK